MIKWDVVYQQRLRARFYLTIALLVLMGIGTVAGIVQAFENPVYLLRPMGIVAILGWVVATAFIAILHRNNNRTLHVLEDWLDSQVKWTTTTRARYRHSNFCSNWVHCALMHDNLTKE